MDILSVPLCRVSGLQLVVPAPWALCRLSGSRDAYRGIYYSVIRRVVVK